MQGFSGSETVAQIEGLRLSRLVVPRITGASRLFCSPFLVIFVMRDALNSYKIKNTGDSGFLL
jgi:hypothetical protein